MHHSSYELPCDLTIKDYPCLYPLNRAADIERLCSPSVS